MANKSLDREFDNGAPAPLYYLWSAESCFLEEARETFIRIVLSSGPRDFNYDVFDASSEPQNIIDAACTLPVMSSRRLVIVRDFHQFTASALKTLGKYLHEPSESTCMVILSQKAPKASLKCNWKVYPLSIREWDIPDWVKRFAAGKGITLTKDALDYLIEFVGFDLGLLIMEVEKLALSEKKTVTGRDVLSSTSMMRTYTSFDLVDALIAGEQTRAFRILKTMLSGNAFDAPVILGTLNWHFREFYSLWLNKGKRPAKMREKTYRALKGHLPSYSEDDFCTIFRRLHEADVGIKTSGRAEIVMEILLIRLLEKGTWN